VGPVDSGLSLSQLRCAVGKVTSRFLAAVLLMALAWPFTLPGLRAAEKPLTHDDVTLLLIGGASSQKLIDLIKQRGIDFQMTAEAATEFRRDGADDSVIQALEGASGKGTPSVAPSPAPPSTAAPPANTSSSPSTSSPPASSSGPTLVRHGNSQFFNLCGTHAWHFRKFEDDDFISVRARHDDRSGRHKSCYGVRAQLGCSFVSGRNCKLEFDRRIDDIVEFDGSFIFIGFVFRSHPRAPSCSCGVGPSANPGGRPAGRERINHGPGNNRLRRSRKGGGTRSE